MSTTHDGLRNQLICYMHVDFATLNQFLNYFRIFLLKTDYLDLPKLSSNLYIIL